MLREMKREIQSIKNQPDQAPQERRQQLAGLGLSGQNVPWQSETITIIILANTKYLQTYLRTWF